MKTASDFLKRSMVLVVFLAFAGQASIGIAQPLGTFKRTGDMSVARQFHTATLLANGKVLIVGGVGVQQSGGTQPLTSAELYDPSTGTFTPTGNMIAPRFSPTATLLNDGRVLIVGSEYPFDACLRNSAELYDPTTGTFSKTGGTVTNQAGGRAILLNDGKVLIVGGMRDCTRNGPVPIGNPEVYDPATGTFAATGPFATTGSTFYVTGGPDISAVSLLSDGRVLIAGEPTSELYDPVSGTFSLTSPMTTPCFGVAGFPPLYIAGRTATLLTNGKVLLTGGEHEDCGRYAKAELYEPSTEKFMAIADMTRQRDNHSATLLRDGTVLIAGGESSDCGGIVGCISFFSGTTTSVESYDPSTASFTAIGDMTARRAGHTATLLMDGSVLLAGGYGYAGIGRYLGTFSSVEIYTPPAPVPAPVVTDLRFDRTSVAVGDFLTTSFIGSNLSAEMFFDVRFTAPGSSQSHIRLNWQKGPKSSHTISAGIAPGVWTITGVRAHRSESDHTGSFVPLNAVIALFP